MKSYKKLVIITTALFGIGALAADLNTNAKHAIPQGLLVKVSTDGQSAVYKLKNSVRITNDQMAKQVADQSISEENKIEKISSQSELDQASSDESWAWGIEPYGYPMYPRAFVYQPYPINFYYPHFSYYYYPYYSYHYGPTWYHYYSAPLGLCVGWPFPCI